MDNSFPILVNVGQARKDVQAAVEIQERNAAEALITATERFFSEQPSQLMISFDVAFLAKIFLGRFSMIKAIWTCQYHDAFDGMAPDIPICVTDPRTDVTEFGVRQQQAYNYAAVHRCSRTGKVMRVLSTAARVRQDSRLRTVPSTRQLPIITPKFSFDHLFLVMAVDYALRPGEDLPRLLVG